MTARTIPDDVRRVQVEAADPEVSAFVSANAGSGKTYVLAQRVINLLLRGVDPAKILCITFTKTAAANMANEVFRRLAAWTALTDTALDKEIALSTGRQPNTDERARARRLFASALETPGGLKVQTIHAFCTRLLHQFPFEANVGARFTVLDEASTTQLLDRLTLDVLLEASAKPDSALGHALAAAIVIAADQTFKEVIGDAIRKRDKIGEWIARAGGLDQALGQLSQTLGVGADETREKLEREYFSHSLIPAAEWPALIEILESGSKADNNHIEALRTAQSAVGRDQIDQYLKVFCTTELEPRKNLLTKKLAEKHSDWLERLLAEQKRVCAMLARERALGARDRTKALIIIAAEVIARYASEKERRALLDYDDLIDKTLALFSRSSAAWVLYKLDLGIDHVLIDEAQDTSPKQWSIVRTIVSEFTPGGARPNVRRTVFAVGDEKQSIFSFQGAAPRAFDEMRREFAGQFDTPEQGWRFLRFHHSFRSGENVLGSVDQVFRTQEIFESVTTDAAGIPPHEALPNAAPGLVELWPLIAPEKSGEDKQGWDAPFDTEREESPRVLLAQRIAAHVKLWMARGLKAGEVMVLVRQRGPLFEAIIRALKTAEIPVAGADRLVLTEHIAVMDLMALADALLLPDDDLALASVLKSPLFGLSEEQLFELAWNRKGSLRGVLRANASFADTERALAALEQSARKLTPFAFFAHVLGASRGRAKFLARLGPEANDALDEFINLALDYETRETPSLQGFAAWLRAAQSEVKRDMEMVRDEVRVMTVHGAKGLEANTVILADTTTKPTGPKDPRLLPLAQGEMVWATAQSQDTAAMTDARSKAQQEARDEYRRLLYVAMTRAKERLVITGVQGDHKISDGCWYQLVDDALRGHCAVEPADDGNGDVLRYRKGHSPDEQIQKSKSSAAITLGSVPGWLKSNASSANSGVRTITPSSAEDDAARAPASGTRAAALLRGSLVHRLMQSLPEIPTERRAKAIDDYLARAGAELTAEERTNIAAQVMLVLEDARFYELFAPGSRAEVPVVGRLQIGEKTVRVSGQIDRLAVTEGSVLIADFKTNRPAPRKVEQALESYPQYVSQLALYRAVLAELYPDKTLRAALVWTEVPDLMEISGEILDAALTRVTSA
ncbi:MAG TPA: double-strand break repair helicase AddA [Pseudolabrys sp.]